MKATDYAIFVLENVAHVESLPVILTRHYFKTPTTKITYYLFIQFINRLIVSSFTFTSKPF